MDNNLIITDDTFERLYQDFVQFLNDIANERFESFKKSEYVDYQENYKYSISQEAKRNLRSSEWKTDDIGTGKIQEAVKSAMLVKVTHNYRSVENNLINWRKINKFSTFGIDKNLEQLFFDLYKNKTSPQIAFNNLSEYFDYQTIAYLFFIKDYNQFLPISQEIFDEIISDKLHIQNFKTSRQLSWENYKTFIEIIKQIQRYLRAKDKDATLLDAHSFLWILGKQRKDWLEEKRSAKVDFFAEADREENIENILPLTENFEEEKLNSKERCKNEFTPTDIIWFKNVTNTETGQAYMDVSDKFVLHFPTRVGDNVSSPQVGEIILLYQKIDDIPVFTHLVAPTNDLIVPNTVRDNYKFGRNVQIIAKTPIEDLIPVSSTDWKGIDLRAVVQGNACRIENMSNIQSVDDLRLNVWERFSPFFTEDKTDSLKLTTELITEVENENPDLTVTEGKLKLVSHYRRERNSKIVRKKKQLAIESNSLNCEVCNFSFREKFGVDFIECHHRTPISQTGFTETKLEDLSLVCANCHRMLHTKFAQEFLSIEELQETLKLPS